MKKRISGIFIFLLICSSLVLSPVQAASHYTSGQTVVLSKDEAVPTDYFAAGSTVLLDGTVDGDAYVAGGTVTISGIVKGDVIAAGGNVMISGEVNGNVRAAGGQVTVAGVVDKNVSIAGGSLTIQKTAAVHGSLVAAGGSISVLGPVEKEVTLAGGQATVDSEVGGSVTGSVQELTLTSQTHIAGDLNYWSTKPATIASGAAIVGKTEYHFANWETAKNKPEKEAPKLFAANLGLAVVNMLFAFIFGLLFLRFLPVFTESVTQTVITKPWASLGIGFLAAILFPILFIILLVTIIGIPLALILLLGMIVYVLLYDVFIAILIGKAITPLHSILGLLIGAVLYGIVTIIPIIGGLVGLIAFCTVMGALIITKRTIYTTFRTKKLI